MERKRRVPAEQPATTTSSGKGDVGLVLCCGICRRTADSCGYGGALLIDNDDECAVCDDCIREYCLLPASDLRRRYGEPLSEDAAEQIRLHCTRDPNLGRRLYFGDTGGRTVLACARLDRFPSDVSFSASCRNVVAPIAAACSPEAGGSPPPQTPVGSTATTASGRGLRAICDVCFVVARDCGMGGGLVRDAYGSTLLVCGACIKEYYGLSTVELSRRYGKRLSDAEMRKMRTSGHHDPSMGRRFFFCLSNGDNATRAIDLFPSDVPFEESYKQADELRAASAEEEFGDLFGDDGDDDDDDDDDDSISVSRTAAGTFAVVPPRRGTTKSSTTSERTATKKKNPNAGEGKRSPPSRARMLIDASNPPMRFYDAVTKRPLSEKEVTAGMQKATVEATPHLCQSCEEVMTTKRCSRCLKAYFCSRECQARQYSVHKRSCYPVDRTLLLDERNKAYREVFLRNLFQEAEGIRWLLANGKTSSDFQCARLIAYDAITAIVTHLDPVGCVLPRTTSGSTDPADVAKASIRDKCVGDLRKAGRSMMGRDGKFRADINMPLFWSFIPERLQELVCTYMI
jgi:hypothetical protein